MTRRRVLLAGLALAALWALGLGDPGDSGTDQAPLPPMAVPAPPSAPMPPLDSFSATLERPLFVRGRRPSGLAAGHHSSPNGGVAPHLVLAGIAASGTHRLALVQMDGIKELQTLAEGSDVAGWTVAAILADRIRLVRGGDVRESVLRDPGGKGNGAAE